MAIYVNGIKVAGSSVSGKSSSTDAVWYYGATPPENTKLLWIDSNEGLKFYNGSAWVPVPVASN